MPINNEQFRELMDADRPTDDMSQAERDAALYRGLSRIGEQFHGMAPEPGAPSIYDSVATAEMNQAVRAAGSFDGHIKIFVDRTIREA